MKTLSTSYQSNSNHLDRTLMQEIDYLIPRLDAIICEQEGEGVMAHLRQIRRLGGGSAPEPEVANPALDWRILDRLSIREAYQIAHALSLSFHLINLCEERARARRLQSESAPPMSLRELFSQLSAAGIPDTKVQQVLDGLEIQPVLTAHPTEAKRRAVLNQLWRLGREWDSPDEALEALWQTEEVREKRVGPLQEVENAVFYFEHTIFDAVAGFYASFDAELAAHYPTVKRRRPFLTFATWVGGDRDGNPFVTPDISRTTAQWHCCAAMDHYERECAELIKELTHATSEPPAVSLPEKGDDTPLFQPYEVFRSQLARLRRQLRCGTARAADLIQVLEEIQRGLVQQKAWRAAQGRVQRLLTQVRTFGLHLAELDIRDHSAKLDAAENELLEEFRVIGDIQKSHGTEAANHFILSMTRGPEDVLRLLRLAGQANVHEVDLVPLFETIEDLERAPRTLAELWRDPHYLSHLEARGSVQEVMVGYSDSNKDGGYVAANWFLYRAQKEIAHLADEAGINLRFFHGKGGSIDRGGGASYRSLRAQPHAAYGGRIRITEQGEVVSLKYSNPVIAQRNLEQLTSAVMAACCLAAPEPGGEEFPEWEAAMDRLARSALDFYQDLVYRTPQFSDYFWQATPIDLIEHLRLGSRPSRRHSNKDIRQLRAIPWVFAWTQSRHLLSSWYGVGHALERFGNQQPDGLTTLREMYRQWPFFRQLLDNAELSLAKTDLAIAGAYASLVESTAVRDQIFDLIEQEYRRSVETVLAVTQRGELLENQPVLASSIRLRSPQINPLNYLQIRFLAQWRKTREEERDEPLRRLLALTVNGIAFGMKSTG